MKLLVEETIRSGSTSHKIQLLSGDLSLLPKEHAVDVLVVSAFQNDYVPTSTSLIGALDRSGLSVAKLADDKYLDLRDPFSCWVSKPVDPRFNFQRLLCIESGWKGSPPEIVSGVFRALTPLLLTEMPNSSVAMPLIGGGDQGWPPEQMLEAILEEAYFWIGRGLQLQTLKIVVHNESLAQPLSATFRNWAKSHPGFKDYTDSDYTSSSGGYQIFVSYSRSDLEYANHLVKTIRDLSPDIKIFQDIEAIAPGRSWFRTLSDAIDQSHVIVSLYSNEYWHSPMCEAEYVAAMIKRRTAKKFQHIPIYLSGTIPLICQNVQYIDCTQNDLIKIKYASQRIVSAVV